MSFYQNAMRPDSKTPSPTSIGDAATIEGLRQAFLGKEEELAALQQMFDSLEQSSQEIEKELEAEVMRAEAQVATLQQENARQKALVVSLQEAKQEGNAEADSLTQQVCEWRQRAEELQLAKIDWEMEQDTLQTKVRVLEASQDSLQHNVERLTEEKIFLQQEVQDFNSKAKETEACLREQMDELAQDLLVLRLEKKEGGKKEGGGEILEGGGGGGETSSALEPSTTTLASTAALEEEADRAADKEAALLSERDLLAAKVKTLEAALLSQNRRRSMEAQSMTPMRSSHLASSAALVGPSGTPLMGLTPSHEQSCLSPSLSPMASRSQGRRSSGADRRLSGSAVQGGGGGGSGGAVAAAVAPSPPQALDESTGALTETSTSSKVVKEEELARLNQDLCQLSIKYYQQRALNSRLLSRMQTIQNKIQVCCRIRPVTPQEMAALASSSSASSSSSSLSPPKRTSLDGSTSSNSNSGQARLKQQGGGRTMVVEALSELEVGFLDHRVSTGVHGNGAWRAFAFDRVWGPEVGQEDVFLDVEALVLSVMEGKAACILAHGQTGSGKTYTMQGNVKDVEEEEGQGISYRLIRKLMDLASFEVETDAEGQKQEGEGPSTPGGPATKAQQQQPLLGYSITLSMVEIYNDDVRDLLPKQLLQGGKPVVLDIRRDADNNVTLPGMVEENVSSVKEALEVIERGNKARSTAATNIHEHSSRSHSIIMLNVTSRSTGKKGRLYLVDLAGSERVKKSAVTGEALKEAQHINKSLSALGDVMEALDKKASYIPYRNSSLTHILSDCFGGTARTLMIVTVCPLDNTSDETHCTLQFATRVRNIQLTGGAGGEGGGKAGAAHLKNMEHELKSFKRENKALALKKTQVEEQLGILKKEYQTLQKKSNTLVEAKGRLTEELRRTMEEQMNLLRCNNESLSERLLAEKTAKDKLTSDVDEAQKMVKRLQQHTEARTQSLKEIRSQLRERDQEVLDLKKSLRKTNRELSSANLLAATTTSTTTATITSSSSLLSTASSLRGRKAAALKASSASMVPSVPTPRGEEEMPMPPASPSGVHPDAPSATAFLRTGGGLIGKTGAQELVRPTPKALTTTTAAKEEEEEEEARETKEEPGPLPPRQQPHLCRPHHRSRSAISSLGAEEEVMEGAAAGAQGLDASNGTLSSYKTAASTHTMKNRAEHANPSPPPTLDTAIPEERSTVHKPQHHQHTNKQEEEQPLHVQIQHAEQQDALVPPSAATTVRRMPYIPSAATRPASRPPLSTTSGLPSSSSSSSRGVGGAGGRVEESSRSSSSTFNHFPNAVPARRMGSLGVHETSAGGGSQRFLPCTSSSSSSSYSQRAHSSPSGAASTRDQQRLSARATTPAETETTEAEATTTTRLHSGAPKGYLALSSRLKSTTTTATGPTLSSTGHFTRVPRMAPPHRVNKIERHEEHHHHHQHHEGSTGGGEGEGGKGGGGSYGSRYAARQQAGNANGNTQSSSSATASSKPAPRWR